MGRLTLPTLTTARLELRPVSIWHVGDFARLNSDSEVMRFISGRASTPDETMAEWRQRLDDRTDVARGLGYWSGRVHGRFVGWWSASSFADDPTTSGLGYRLLRSAWGRGLATEGAAAMRDHAFTVPGVERCVASTMATNAGSRRVLEKTGMTHVDTTFPAWDDPLPGSELGEVVYEIARTGGPRSL